jgi:hypothetical protein
LSSVVKYSPSSDTWSTVTYLPVGCFGHAAVAVGSAIYAIGGLVRRQLWASASVHKFDSKQDTWSEVAPMPQARYAHAACVLGSDIYVFGGKGDIGHQQDSVIKYNTVTNVWTTLAPMPSVCVNHSATTLGGQIYIMEGSGCKVLLFDPDSGAWSNFAPTLSGKRKGSLFVLDGCLYAAGGKANSTSVERYDAGTNAWTAVADLLEGRKLFGAVTIPAIGRAEEQNLFDALIAKGTR